MCSLPAHGIARCREGRVEDGNVSEGDVAYRQIEIAVIGPIHGFETLNQNVISRVQVFENESCQGVFLKACCLHMRILTMNLIDKSPDTGTGFEESLRFDSLVVEDTDDCLRNLRRCVEGGEYRRLEAVEITLVGSVVCRVLFQYGVQLFNQR